MYQVDPKHPPSKDKIPLEISMEFNTPSMETHSKTMMIIQPLLPPLDQMGRNPSTI